MKALLLCLYIGQEIFVYSSTGAGSQSLVVRRGNSGLSIGGGANRGGDHSSAQRAVSLKSVNEGAIGASVLYACTRSDEIND